MSRTKNNIKTHLNIVKNSYINRLMQIENSMREIDMFKAKIHNEMKSLVNKAKDI